MSKPWKWSNILLSNVVYVQNELDFLFIHFCCFLLKLTLFTRFV